ncbi:MAG TPA: hypothetical protein DCP92_12305 [Nitrospiraceae bacterium]|jgi:uncharacterized lipoprotein|nr:hypothetical protein [Nitrospiraceae bacterium]
MKTLFKIAILSFCLTTLIACATSKPYTMTYSTQSLPRGKSDLNAETFKYLPADNKILPNQIENTAMGSILLDTDVSEYVKHAFQLELERSGYFSLTPKITFDCDIMRLKCDDFGYSVDWYLDITCYFIDNTTKTEVANESANITKKHLQKFGGLENFQRTLNSVIFEAYDKIISSPKLQQVLK